MMAGKNPFNQDSAISSHKVIPLLSFPFVSEVAQQEMESATIKLVFFFSING
jgi:hypothetical protein